METNCFSYLAAASLLLAVPAYASAGDSDRPAEMVTASTPSSQAGASATLTPQENLRDWVKGIKPAAGPGLKEEKGSGHYSSRTVYRQFKE